MSGEAMAQGVGMDGTVKACALRGSLAGVVYRFCVDRVIRSMPTVAGKEPVAGFSSQPTPVLAQLFKQLGAEHDVAVFAALFLRGHESPCACCRYRWPSGVLPQHAAGR